MQLGGSGGAAGGIAGGAAMEGFVEVLRDWEREGWGWVTEVEGGVVYLEMGRKESEEALVVDEEEGTC